MNRGLIHDKDFRPQFSGHETFPLRYGWQKKVYDSIYDLEMRKKSDESKYIFINENSISRFGVGKNMVSSMRHWATCSNVIRENDEKNIVTTELAKLILSDDGLDPWMENKSSIWAFHWHICSSSNKALYLWLFNYYNGTQFDRQSITKLIDELCTELQWKTSPATLKRDVECLVRAYVNKPARADAFTEDQIESPLAELGVIQSVNKKDTFQIKRGGQPSLGIGAFIYGLVDFWKRYTCTSRTLTLETITYEPCSPGRVFCLDEAAVADRLYSVEKASSGVFSWSETAGLRQVIANKPLDEVEALAFLPLDYLGQE
nr:DUF4007 family protein [uncultured Cohaesibacter sp.]